MKSNSIHVINLPKGQIPESFKNLSQSQGFPSRQTIDDFRFDETISVVLYGKYYSKPRSMFFFLASVGTGGIIYLIARWFPHFQTWSTTTPAPLLHADRVLVVDSFGQVELLSSEIIPIDESPAKRIFSTFVCEKNGVHGIVILNYRCNRFVLDPSSGLFVAVDNLLPKALPSLDDYVYGIDDARHAELNCIFGKNTIDLKEVSIAEIFYNEVLHPFFIFQVASFFIWIFENYYLYASVILMMALSSVGVTIFETKKNLEKMRNMTKFSSRVQVLRNGTTRYATSEDVCPGDLVILDDTVDHIPCDGILVNGDAIVDESMLSGETVPVSKVEITDEAYSSILLREVEDPRVSLFAGTRLLRSRMRHGRPALLLVTRTGFLTAKGTLVQSILFPRPNSFRFYRDSMAFIGIMGVIAAFGFAASVVNFVIQGEAWTMILQRALDIITVVVPPALPATMAIGTVFAIKRLEGESIYCISPPRINVSAKLDVFCFDKTGTLTEEGLELFGVLPYSPEESKFSELIGIEEGDKNLRFTKMPSAMESLMSTCHSLRRIHGKLLGDSLDLRMFESTRWELEETLDVGEAIVPTIVRPPGSKPLDVANLLNSPCQKGTENAAKELGIIRQFEFSSSLRRMSVITRNIIEDSVHVYCKGSPESLVDICRPETIPSDYESLLVRYAHSGYRVIACAYKACPDLSWFKSQKLGREAVEKDLTFLGFLVFENRLKDASAPTIQMLKIASIPTMMATGDNILTAISVGRACGMLDKGSLVFYPQSFSNVKSSRDVLWQCVDDINIEFDPVRLEPVKNCFENFSLAVTGEFFELVQEIFPANFVEHLLSKVKIYARMSPQQKQLLVEVLQRKSAIVGFCGDGANDCGALKSADVGVSLSQAEASIAAPFTSKIQDISCIPKLILEGRASLVTSFCCFKYMTLYSMVQFTTLLFLYSFMSSMTDNQFVYVDLLVIVPLGVLMSRYAPSKKLVAKQPNVKLISPPLLTSVLGHIAIQGVFQMIVYLKLASPLRVGWTDASHDNTFNPAATVMFMFSAFLYIFTAVIFSEGRPFRQRIYWPFIIYFVITIAATLLLMSESLEFLNNWLLITPLSAATRVSIFISALAYLVVAYIFDRVICHHISQWIESFCP